MVVGGFGWFRVLVTTGLESVMSLSNHSTYKNKNLVLSNELIKVELPP